MTKAADARRVIVVLCEAINWQIISNGVGGEKADGAGRGEGREGADGRASARLPISPRALGHISSRGGSSLSGEHTTIVQPESGCVGRVGQPGGTASRQSSDGYRHQPQLLSL